MAQKLIQNRSLSILLVGMTLLALVALMLPLFAAAQEGTLPPRGGDPPTPTPVPAATPEPTAAPAQNMATTGSRLQLHVHYGPNWPWHLMAWQDLWTEVQWTDGKDWFVVEGWRGQMDNIAQQDSHWVSLREWWVDAKDLGDGPFRWVIYDHQDGAVLSTSDSFMLPSDSGQILVIDQTLSE